jgi:hypothetical protein
MRRLSSLDLGATFSPGLTCEGGMRFVSIK